MTGGGKRANRAALARLIRLCDRSIRRCQCRLAEAKDPSEARGMRQLVAHWTAQRAKYQALLDDE